MQTNITRLQFIIRFVGMDLPNMRPGDLLNLREDLMAFLMGGPDGNLGPHKGGIVACPLEPPFPQDMTLQDLEGLQAELKILMNAIGIQGDMTLPGTKTIPIKARYALVGSRAQRTPGWGTLLTVTGPTRDMVLLTTLWLLNNESGDRIVPCPACRTVFYRVGRQHYCSSACRSRVAGKQWREREGNAEKNREKAHAHYKAKKTAAGSATVQRRPRQRKGEPTPA